MRGEKPCFRGLSISLILTPPIYSLDFTICNPPFYSSSSDLVASASAKSHPPYSACTGAAVEMVTPGGEVAFVTRMIKESLVLKRKCQWYTSMLGKLSSVQSLLQLLQECQVRNWAVKEFIHGSKTRRWAIAWTFHKARPTKVCNQFFFFLSFFLFPVHKSFPFLLTTLSLPFLRCVTLARTSIKTNRMSQEEFQVFPKPFYLSPPSSPSPSHVTGHRRHP